MLERFQRHNLFQDNQASFDAMDPHLKALASLRYQYVPAWWQTWDTQTPGIYILTGGRQVGKSTSCKLLIQHCLKNKIYESKHILYLTCDEIFDAKELARLIRFFLDSVSEQPFLLIIDEITFVPQWQRVIKGLADEGAFRQGICLLTGSDTLILKEAAAHFPGRRGHASQTDFHIYPLSFAEYVSLITGKSDLPDPTLKAHFEDYLQTGGFLRAINDFAENQQIGTASYLTYEQWIRGDFLKQGKHEETLIAILAGIYQIGVSQISYSKLTQKIGLISKETVLSYCGLLDRMDVLINLQAFDQNKKMGFPRKDRKFHFTDPFIQQTIFLWLQREGILSKPKSESLIVEACVASHCARKSKSYYVKGTGEIDVISFLDSKWQAIEVKWGEQLRPTDMKMLKQFEHRYILTKNTHAAPFEDIPRIPVYRFLLEHL